MNEGIKMQISAFVDGELPETEAQLLLRRLSQDVELRQQAAEYFAIGRALRGQSSIAEIGGLRGRIAAAIDDRLVEQEFDEIEPVGRRYARPLAGFAIAATVAIAAIFGLQQMSTVPGTGPDAALSVVAEGAAEESYTVPDMEYFERHSRSTSETGNNSFDFRRVSAELNEDGELIDGLEEIDPPQDTVDDEQPEERQSP
jgi:sigma-E factor negative regulatory protein RseA